MHAVGDKLGLMDGQNLKFATSQVLRQGWSRGEKDGAAKRAAAAVTAVHARPRGERFSRPAMNLNPREYAYTVSKLYAVFFPLSSVGGHKKRLFWGLGST